MDCEADDQDRWLPAGESSPTPTVGEQLTEAHRSIDELLADAQAYESTTRYAELLTFLGSFRSYSAFNALLVNTQRPGARYVAPASRWRRDHGRVLRPGAQAIAILRPRGPVMFVYDVSDTEGLDGAPALPREIDDPFNVTWSVQVDSILEMTLHNVARDGVRVTMARHGSELAARIRPATTLGTVKFSTGPRHQRVQHDIPLAYEMELNERLRPHALYPTVCHELAHLYCGHMGPSDQGNWPNRRRVSREIAELEAESIAFVVARRLDSTVIFPPYLHGYLQAEPRMPPLRLTSVLRVVHEIEEMGRARLGLRPKARGRRVR